MNSQGAGPGGTPAVVWVGEAVPTAAPRDILAESRSPTEVALAWRPPLLAHQNGDLLGYKVTSSYLLLPYCFVLLQFELCSFVHL